MVPGGLIGAHLAGREALIADATPGLAAARSLSDATDGAVLTLVRAVPSRAAAPFALFALGGYGARRLLPHSDIDLLLVSDAPARDLEPLVRQVTYPLWDAGLQLTPQTRTPADHVRAIREDLATATAFLTARFLAGDPAYAERAVALAFRRIARDRQRLLALIGARERPGSPYLLEPDLKNGAGGQRDLDELVWRAAIADLRPQTTPDALVRHGLLDETALPGLRDAQQVLATARWLVHRAHGRAANVLDLDDAADPAMDADAAQRTLERVHHTLLDVRDTAAGRPAPERTPLDLAATEALGAKGAPGVAALERAAYALRLDHAMPGFGALMALRRPGLSHRYTVGAHCLRALAASLDPAGPGATLPGDPGLRRALTIAALAHDVGKADPAPGHAAHGASAAAEAARRFGCSERTVDAAAVLVREHLLLAEVATARDLADEDVVLQAAARIGDPALVAPLFALTAADMTATGPDVWTPWRAALITELAAKLERALSPDVDGAGIVRAAEATREEAARIAASQGAPRAVLDVIAHAPLHYLAERAPADVLHDARMVRSIAGPGAPGRVALGVRPGPAEGTWLLDVITRDRPGLFATIAGALALTGLDTLAARAHTGADGIALDTFTVAMATQAHADTTTWNALERTLTLALAGRLDLDARLAERRRHYPARQAADSPSVRIGPRGPSATAVHVRAPDRVGLLHDIARTLAIAGLDIRRASIGTRSGMAIDTFDVTGREGEPLPADALRALLDGPLAAALGSG